MSKIDIKIAKSLYEEFGSLHKVAQILHTSHISLSALFKENHITLQNIGKRRDLTEIEIKEMIAEYTVNHKTTQEIADKFKVRIKKLRQIFRDHNITISKWNGHVKKVVVHKEKPVKVDRETIKCPYCDWKTVDVSGKSYSLQRHLTEKHPEISVFTFESEYPELTYLVKHLHDKTIAIQENKLVKCEQCGKYLKLITDIHLKKHGLTKAQYLALYPHASIISHTTKTKLHKCMEKMIENPNWERFTSKPEQQIADFIRSFGFEVKQHVFNSIIRNREIDIYVPEKNLAIEFDGLIHHTEEFGGKNRQYHKQKTEACEKQGIRLLHIFENEWVYRNDIVLSKLRHILGVDNIQEKIMARKCTVQEIQKEQADSFLEQNHIQGGVSSTVYIGALYNGDIVAVMTFKKDNREGFWELTRFATKNGCVCQGIGGKLFSYFTRTVTSAKQVKSFADRRWSSNIVSNLYKTLGFTLDKVLEPDYKYYYTRDNKPELFHKFSMRKKKLLSKYPEVINSDMSESQMARTLGYDKVWDCGLLRYVWNRK